MEQDDWFGGNICQVKQSFGGLPLEVAEIGN